MAPPPGISLIIACCNQRSSIALVLTSAFHQQTEVPFEILVCDDGSADATFDRIQELASASGADIRYLWQPDRGFRVSRSRNNAIRCACGEILVFVDADSWLFPSCLNDHWHAHRDPEAIVCGMRHMVTTTMDVNALDLTSWERFRRRHRQMEHLEQQRWLCSDHPWMACLGGNFSVRRSPEVYFDERFESWGSEDRDLAFRLFRSGLKPRLLNEPNVIHFRRPGEDFTAMSHDQTVAFIRNKLFLKTKYPNGELAPSVELVKHCHLSPRTQQWSIGPLRHAKSADDIFREFDAWQANHP